ncbi:late secretory pathway protein [Fagus crenata]
MKTVLALCVAFLLILATLQTNAETLKVEQRRLKAKRQLLNEATLGRKVSVGVGPADTKDQTVNQSPTSTETKTDGNANNDDDEVNPTYGSYGHASGSSTEFHHHVYVDGGS